MERNAVLPRRKSPLAGAKALVKALGPVWFLAPALVLMGVWTYWPLLKTVYYSFIDWNMLPTTQPVWVGMKNYLMLVQHPDFARALWNTLCYILGMLPFSVLIPMALAIATDKMSPVARNVYRVLFFLPMVMPPVTVSVVWRWLFHPMNGIINQALLGVGLVETGVNFLSDMNTAMLSINLIAGWKMIGFSTLMFSAALTGIDKAYYEAARVDKVSPLRQTLTITLPLISPTVMYMLMLSILFTAQWTFAYINVLTQGGPVSATTNVYYLMYTYGIKNFNVGMGSASAILFFVMFGILALVMNRVNKKIAFYDN